MALYYYYYYYYYYYWCVRFVNLSMSSLGVFSDECFTFLINIAIRATYYIFCCRNRSWDSPDLMQFWFFFFWLLFCFVFVFVFVFVFNNPISSSICKLPIRSEIYNCTFKNTNKVSIIIIIIITIIIINNNNFIKNDTCYAGHIASIDVATQRMKEI